ncbi:MAG: valine--tRNA ligase [Synergistales bacterium]|nr:valine--tRNA ligase [Synergistales bacterium]
MKKENLPKTYDPKPIEDKWYQFWLDEGLFESEVDADREPFCIVIPPPNVTGSLHMGHALNETLQDVLCRYKRMKGFNVLWVPGTDHAGIATQNVVERQIAREGLTRHDLGREAFVKRVWLWKEQYGNRIISQLKKIGASCDWRRERFTMDEGLSEAVRSVFVRLFKEDLIYRGKYIINWCPRCHTALSDLEVEHEEEAGNLYHVAYPFVDGEGSLVVATTRPETILGDVAIAVHPRDERNASLCGRRVRVPLVDREIPVIEDNMVDPAFGTGCVKITPAHDPNDFLVGQRHKLEAPQVIDGDGLMNEAAGPYRGLDRFEARKKILADLKAQGLLVKVEEHGHSVGHCYRCHTIIEPYLSEQWFVRAKPLADAGVEAVQKGHINWVPEQWLSTYYQWMENIRDWCISRQLWWGHRIPAWYCADCNHITVSESDPAVCEKCGSSAIAQDEDVLDTWFSSALWPFSTLGWPKPTKDIAYYYPTSILITGFDIIFFWVSRMIMMGLKFMDGEVPFRDVYIHALVRDENGQKMSKSKGNVIDPLDIIEKSGADALRLTLAALTVQGRDIFLSDKKIETYRFFLNKLWNASRFALMNLEELDDAPCSVEGPLRFHDKWLLSRLDQAIGSVTQYLDGYFFGEAARLLYDFVWGEFCDWYLEMAKPALRGEEGQERQRSCRLVLRHAFNVVLRLLHPIIPFVTEELWRAFDFGEIPLDREPWPERAGVDDEETLAAMTLFQETVRNVRNLRAEAGVPPTQVVPRILLALHDEKDEACLQENADLLALLTRVESVHFRSAAEKRPARCLSAVLPFGAVYLEAEGLLSVENEISRLSQEIDKIRSEITRSRSKLQNEKFISRAPEDIVEKERSRLAEAEKLLKRHEENIESLSRS